MKKTKIDSLTISIAQVDRIAYLANIPTTHAERELLSHKFSDTLREITKLKSINVSGVEPTYQITGLQNVLRTDQVLQDLSFTQAQAVSNARRTHQGYFVVKRILEDSDK